MYLKKLYVIRVFIQHKMTKINVGQKHEICLAVEFKCIAYKSKTI